MHDTAIVENDSSAFNTSGSSNRTIIFIENNKQINKFITPRLHWLHMANSRGSVCSHTKLHTKLSNVPLTGGSLSNAASLSPKIILAVKRLILWKRRKNRLLARMTKRIVVQVQHGQRGSDDHFAGTLCRRQTCGTSPWRHESDASTCFSY